MATGHFYKKWDDAGAPTLTNTAGSLISILDWALDVGTATYWEKVFTGTNKGVYRSKTGLRPYLRVLDSTETAQPAMYETMTDVDTGTGRCPDGITQNTNFFRVIKADAGDVSFQYHIVGDSEFFFMALNHDDDYSQDGTRVHWRSFYFGEVPSFLSVDNYNCIVGASYNSDGNDADFNAGNGDLFVPATSGRFHAGITSDSAAIGDPGYNVNSCWLRNQGGTVNSSGGYPWTPLPAGCFIRLDIAEAPAFYTPYYIQCSNGSTSSSSTGFWNPGNGGAVTRGRLPYIYATPWIQGNDYGGPVTGDIITLGASQFVAIGSWGASSSRGWSSSGVYLIRITDDEPDRP